jgi:FkbM family methyltransferase
MGYSLNNLDEKMIKYLNFNSGFFIEAGANDGRTQSNTLLFEERLGWFGLLVEPSKIKYEECVNNRPKCIVENYALVSDGFTRETVKGDFGYSDCNGSLCGQVTEIEDYFDNDLKSSLTNKNTHHKIVDVPVITMNRLLEKHEINNIDFFSLDVEGYEIEVLNGMNLDKYRPTYFLIETSGIKERYDRIHEYMKNKNYEFIDAISDNDSLFKSK